MSKVTVYDVIVIGGGTSGLATASQLVELGHTNILVLEASNRLGGRIRSMETSGKNFYFSKISKIIIINSIFFVFKMV